MGLDEVAVGFGRGCEASLRWAFAVVAARGLGHADLLAGGETQVGVGTLGIDAHLARAQKLLRIAVADVGKPQPEPAIEAQTRLLGCDLDHLDGEEPVM